MEGKSLYAACSLRRVGRYPFLNRHERDANFRASDQRSVCRDADLECGFLLKTIRPLVETMSNPNSIIAADAELWTYIPGNGMISTISIHAPGICRWGWSLPNIFVAASCDSACTTE